MTSPPARGWPRWTSRLALAVSAVLSACGAEDSGEQGGPAPAGRPIQEEGLSVIRAGDTLALVNADSVPIYFAVFSTDIPALIEWAPCDTPISCPHVPPRDSIGVTVPPRSGSAPEPLTVFWWRLVPASDTGARWAPDRVRAIDLP